MQQNHLRWFFMQIGDRKRSLGLFSLVSVLLIAILVYGVQAFNSPSACSGQWTSCSNAFSDNTNSATASVSGTANKSGIWNDYGFSLSSSDQINKVVVRADFFASKTSGYIVVRVSGDGGLTYGPSHTVGGNTAEQSFFIDVTNDLSWAPSKLNNSNLRVNVTCSKIGGGANPTCNLDWIPVNVTYTPCIRANPTVTLNPPERNGSAGQTVNYTTKVINNDNNACGASTFDLTATFPLGWSGSFNTTTLLIDPGQLKMAEFLLTSENNATAGNYTFNTKATNSGAPSLNGNRSGYYVVT